jgi:2-methylcitrate dehydratase PrpD
VALYFPNRVRVTLRDGREETEQVDLPIGSYAAPEAGDELRRKFVREVGRRLGAERAERAFRAGNQLGETSLDDFVTACAQFTESGTVLAF